MALVKESFVLGLGLGFGFGRDNWVVVGREGARLLLMLHQGNELALLLSHVVDLGHRLRRLVVRVVEGHFLVQLFFSGLAPQ